MKSVPVGTVAAVLEVQGGLTVLFSPPCVALGWGSAKDEEESRDVL